MRPKSIVLLMLALGCGVVASLGINQVMSRGTPVVSANDTDMVSIYVAMKDIEINDLVTPEALKLEPWPKDRVPNGAITKLEQLKGRRARQKIFAGEPVLEQKLLPKGEAGARPTDHVPPGYRVVAVRVDAQATGGYLVKPGDRVDLIVHMKKNPARNVLEETTRTFLQNVKVFAVNSEYTEKNGQKVITAKTVSLLVTPEQAEKVTFASQLGKIVLALRPPQDATKVHTTGVTVRRLLSPSWSSGPPLPSAQGGSSSKTTSVAQVGQQVSQLLKLFKDPVVSSADKASQKEEEKEADEKTKRKREKPWRITLLRGEELEQLQMVDFGVFQSADAVSADDEEDADEQEDANEDDLADSDDSEQDS